jgi:hypothetical protein
MNANVHMETTEKNSKRNLAVEINERTLDKFLLLLPRVIGTGLAASTMTETLKRVNGELQPEGVYEIYITGKIAEIIRHIKLLQAKEAGTSCELQEIYVSLNSAIKFIIDLQDMRGRFGRTINI